MKAIRFSHHARSKMLVLAAHGWAMTEDQVIAVVRQPERIESGHGGRKIAQRRVDADHVLRVVFEDLADAIVIVTMYPGRRARYDKD